MRKIVLMTILVMIVTTVSLAGENPRNIEVVNYEIISPKVNPFCMAIVKGDLETVKKMIEYGSDVNEKSNGKTPLMYAARYNRVDIIELLVKKGADIGEKDNRGNTALKLAKKSNAKAAIAVLRKLI